MVDKKGDRSRVNLHKEWAVHPEPFPYQTMVRDITAFAPNYKNKPMSVTELFPVGAQCFLMAALQYGCQAEVSTTDRSQFCMQDFFPKGEGRLVTMNDNTAYVASPN